MPRWPRNIRAPDPEDLEDISRARAPQDRRLNGRPAASGPGRRDRYFGAAAWGVNRAHGRRGLLQHLDHRLSGNPDRPFLCRPDHHLHLPPYRQCRRQRRGHRDDHRRRRAGWSCAPTITDPSNWRATPASGCLAQGPQPDRHDRRRHAAPDPRIRDGGAPAAAASPTSPGGDLDLAALQAGGRAPGPASKAWIWPRTSPAARPMSWDETPGPGQRLRPDDRPPAHHVVAIDFGAKRNILRCLAGLGCKVTVVPATASAEDILRHEAGRHLPVQRAGRSGGDRRLCRAHDPGLLETGLPIFGICLGHQILALALGAKTARCITGPSRRQPSGQGPGDRQGRDHQPEPRLRGGRGEPARMASSLHPPLSLFDQSNEGLRPQDDRQAGLLGPVTIRRRFRLL